MSTTAKQIHCQTVDETRTHFAEFTGVLEPDETLAGVTSVAVSSKTPADATALTIAGAAVNTNALTKDGTTFGASKSIRYTVSGLRAARDQLGLMVLWLPLSVGGIRQCHHLRRRLQEFDRTESILPRSKEPSRYLSHWPQAGFRRACGLW